MKIKQRIIGSFLAATTAYSLISTVSFADSVKYDFNNDGCFDLLDAIAVVDEYLSSDVCDAKYDVNNDKVVDLDDALFLVDYYLSTPEPETTAAESILDNYEKKWAYNTLTKNQQEAYALMLKGALKTESSISLGGVNLTKSDLKKVFWACDYDNPQLLNIYNGYNASYSSRSGWNLNIIYSKTASQTTSALKKVEETTADVIAEAKKLSSDYDRVKLFHDWIINRTVYVGTGNKYISETDGPILYGEALCEGYSRAFEYLCQSVGIECVCIAGTASSSLGSGGHMWNMVKVDGNWYHIDVTWDDPVRTDGKAVLRYDYFLISDAQIKKDHVIDNYFPVPTAPKTYAS